MDFIVLGFSLFLLVLALGIKLNRPVSNPHKNRFSILIACRNEEKNLHHLFQSLDRLDYSEALYEIIIVDDASEDTSPELIEKFCLTKKNASFYHIPQKDIEYMGKKAALKLAAGNAKYEFLLFTDADCVVPDNWLTSYNRHISYSTGMVVGSVLEVDASKLQSFSRNINAGIYASSVGLHIPFACSGGNMCIKREIFEKVGGYSKIRHHIAGDDKLMLNLVKKEKSAITYNPDSLVYTFPTAPKNILAQKKRRYGKFKMSTSGIKFLQLLILGFYIYLPWSIIVNQSYSNLIIYYLSSLVFLFVNIRTHKIKHKYTDLFYVLVFPYYLIYFSVLGMLSGWKWK